jgi:hypothetical protein
VLRPKKITERGVKVASVNDNSFRAPPGCAMHLGVQLLAERIKYNHRISPF